MELKGNKPVFNYEDTWDLDTTLAPIICEAFKTFKQVLIERNEENKVFGVPMWAYEELGFKHDDWGAYTSEQEKEAFEYYMETLDKIIYAFDLDNEPCLSDYDVEYHLNEITDGNFDIQVENIAEDKRYRKDTEEWLTKCKEGRMIMVEKWQDWWW